MSACEKFGGLIASAAGHPGFEQAIERARQACDNLDRAKEDLRLALAPLKRLAKLTRSVK